MTYEMKSIAGKTVLFVMAADAEYGVFLRTRISPLMTGVGPVEAAVVLTKELSRLSSHDDLPDLVVSLGSAGSATLEQAEIYQVSAVSYRDMDASAFGFEKGKTPFLDLPVSVELPLRIPGIPAASLSTGANVVSGAAYQSIDAQMVDMETFAVLRACQSFGIPLIGLRGISDGRHDVNHIDDWTQYLHVIDKKLALAVDSLQTALEDGVFWF
ncbi:5'-methylthioadenosine/S-adenosylhomocysteine nucleosidase [Agrobacterium sp. MA01]|uniref:5'-methylthioadenosine/S-adenosylhomocysteine nucleosidase n=1 Tax=Agrobacterium sp. MA01 TaxID=2664893 RepID=UPI00129B491E|nr:5'-methylthioadenosine/S-adenosylhomocysteine nucleosidase [Agrobacterium sp. MA01]QGG92926.1 5'-methylthioadenosine/S-adenosylhomocysteine nucleosidase [Agrobacterium sp. MA01]